MSENTLNVACLQHHAEWENKPATHARVEALLDANPIAPNSLLLLPEMFATGYSMNARAIAETGPGMPYPDHSTLQFIAAQARRRKLYILAGISARASAETSSESDQFVDHNQAVLFSPDGEELLRYSKMRPFSLAGEPQHYRAGNELKTFKLGGFTVCPFICYDLRFPELFRAAVLQHGVDLFLVIAAWPLPRDAHWTTLLTARAIENQAYVAAVNHCGRDPKVQYFGKSRIIDPKGQMLVEAGSEPRVIQQTIDRETVENWRRDFPALRDAREANPTSF